MPVSFLALARTLLLITDIVVSRTMRLFLNSQQYFVIRSLKIFIGTFAITYDFAKNVMFLILEFSDPLHGLHASPCFSHVLGALHLRGIDQCGSSL